MTAATLFLHSTGTTPALWGGVPEAVWAGSERVAPANLGIPPHPPLPRGQAFEVREDVEAALAAVHGFNEVHLVGHSYGGVLALKLLPLLGARAKSLFLYEPVLFGALVLDRAPHDPAAAEEARGLLQHPWFLSDEVRGGTDPWIELFIDYWNRPGSWARMAPEQQAFTRALGWKMYREVRACFLDQEPFEQHRLHGLFTTLAMGERSPRASRAMQRRLAELNPEARLVELPKTGHMAPLTHPALVHQALLDHVRARVSPSDRYDQDG